MHTFVKRFKYVPTYVILYISYKIAGERHNILLPENCFIVDIKYHYLHNQDVRIASNRLQLKW